ncbi:MULTISPECIES: helix-turn-helix domain-containing protein [unclassified Flavobacterium]|jgi:AraC-like DNA-binding protein/tetratricopeptide (TPR) repeat protein|uniref:helix-turn-helix domain-containing protein n=1 Tax=unclassified Flavobacterium TaxID=196869 RepID=UPI00064A1985|nr:helix-turn-helix domain-containing protein [Flavobacterium sp. ABG]KLT71622.1 hypothetical protein AB674_00745 [Flavobacterium sp. ABG]
MCNKKLFLVIHLLLYNIIIAQNLTQIPDSLKKTSYDTFREKIYTDPNSRFTRNYIYAKSYLLKAKSEKNTRETIYGYDLLAEIFEDFDQSIKYSDTSIALANKKYPKALPYLYSTRGYIFYNKKRLKESLNCFLIAIKDTANLSPKLVNDMNYSIGLIKKTQGHYSEAIPIYQKCVEKAYQNKEDNYLRYVLGLAELYNRIGKTDESENLTKKGINACRDYDFGNFYLPYFISNRGKNYLQRKKYNTAILDLKIALRTFEKNNDFSNYAENCFYIGESYTKLNQSNDAVLFYKKVDSIFKVKNDISLLTIPAYKEIIAYYKGKNNYKKVIYYSDQFIKADKLLDDDYKYITSTIAKKYDIIEVISLKQKMISSLNKEKFSLQTIILFLFSGIMMLFILLYLNNKKRKKEVEKQKQLFESYRRDREQQMIINKESLLPVTKKASITNMDESMIAYILDCLQKFELELKYIEKEYTIEILASEFKTNSKYLSQVINSIKEIPFTRYINNLRIEYILDKLENDKKTLEYTIQALSEICGYNSVQTFTRAFTTYTKMKPSNFIKQLKINNN